MRAALLIGGLTVVALVVTLYLVLSNSDDGAENSGGSAPAKPTEVVTTTPGTTARPGLPGETAPELPSGGQHPRDYVVGDIRVRDHRKGDNAPLDIPPNPLPAEGRAIKSAITHEIAQQVKAVMMQCVADLPKDARGDNARVEGQIVISIKNKQAKIEKSLIHLRNVSGDAVEPTKQCIEQKSIGLQNPAIDEADLENYPINLSFAIPAGA